DLPGDGGVLVGALELQRAVAGVLDDGEVVAGMAAGRLVTLPALRHAACAERLAAPVLDEDRAGADGQPRPERGGGQAGPHTPPRHGRATRTTRHATPIIRRRLRPRRLAGTIPAQSSTPRRRRCPRSRYRPTRK